MIKVMHFIHGLNTGGAETLVKNYALNSNNELFSVVVLCLKHESSSPYERELKEKNIRVIYISDHLLFKTDNNLLAKCLNRINRFYMVRKIIKRESPDVLHLHLSLNRFVRFARPSKNTKLFYTIHSDISELWFKDKKSLKDFRAASWLVKHYGMKIIVLHEKMKTAVKELFSNSDVILLNNGVDIDKLKRVNDKKQTKKGLGIPINSFVIGHIGRFSAVKNQTFLVDIFTEIKKNEKRAFLLMIGDGADKNIICDKLDKSGARGKYLIVSNRNDIPDLLNIMDVFIFPSLFEGLPLSLVEAQIENKPCFVSNTIDEYVDISNLVTRIPLESSAEEWAKMVLAYKKPKRIIVDDDNWDIKTITKQLEQIYLETLSESKNGKK